MALAPPSAMGDESIGKWVSTARRRCLLFFTKRHNTHGLEVQVISRGNAPMEKRADSSHLSSLSMKVANGSNVMALIFGMTEILDQSGLHPILSTAIVRATRSPVPGFQHAAFWCFFSRAGGVGELGRQLKLRWSVPFSSSWCFQTRRFVYD